MPAMKKVGMPKMPIGGAPRPLGRHPHRPKMAPKQMVPPSGPVGGPQDDLVMKSILSGLGKGIGQ